MAESPDANFRNNEYGSAIPIPEVQCPSTPCPRRNIKSPELSTSSSSEESEVDQGDGSHSPPPNCAICLGKCKNKSFTDSCMHQFCFKCLLEWSKVKPECPLCKQTFKSIIHNVKSMDQFEEYLVQQPIQASLNPDAYPFTIPAHLVPRLPSLLGGRRNMFMDDLAMNTLDLTGTSSSTSFGNQDAHRVSTFDRRIVPDPAQLLDMYRQETIQGETGSGSLSQLWRRYVYDRKLYAQTVPDITGRLRESSARFYRDNPSQVHRLMPWINRDIVCLLRNTEHDVSAVLEEINAMLMTCNILSPEFRRRLQPFLGTKTAHFIHELNNFARSQYDMIGYDRVVQYLANNDEIVIAYSSTSSAGSDVESVNNDTHQEATTSRRGHQANSGGGFNLYTTTTSTSAQESAINLATHNRGATTSTIEIVSAPSVERPTNIVLSSTSSDECEFVLEQKPPHLRTPELVSLNSDSDSDVVFVQETKTSPTPNTTTRSSSSCPRVRRAQRRRATTSTIQTYSTSETDEYNNYVDVTTPKRLKTDERMVNAVVEVSPENVTKLENDQLPKVKEEFNQGASTSTGLQSGYRSTRLNLERDRRSWHYIESSDSDEIADCDTSSTDSYHSTEDSNSSSDSDTSWSKTRRNSNKQSLKRSRQQKVSSRRKSRRQPAASSKSKRSKRSKTSSKNSSHKSSSSSKKKKTAKRSRRKFSKSNTHRRERNVSRKDYTTDSEEEQQPQSSNAVQVQQPDHIQASPWTCTPSSPDSVEQHHGEGGHSQVLPQKPRSSTSSPELNSNTSESNEATEHASFIAPIIATTDSPTRIEPILPPTPQTIENPNANLAIYSDTD